VLNSARPNWISVTISLVISKVVSISVN
jgi:hypothetical protein